ncbi:MAG: paraslipin [Gammaproteobacteria bacterium]|nr:paraslipin [Gammaproteobacteria bacterium]MBU6509948.1 paraslipin [Gammaproteobacteria bacterium]MDE1983281.1 paraslipin [Gammaproteobacteria bacterium]MDE2108052.1 paraslipin [Gammaproteobacteria bacterium]MDE2460975.1 paraslipin [Gammaproteobacteria bacterium]
MGISVIIGILIIIFAAMLTIRSVRIVPQQHSWVVERLGKFHGALGSGMQIIVPFFDRVAYRFDMREIPMDVPEQVCITRDNTRLSVDGVLYYQITNAQNAAYGTIDVVTAVVQLVQTTMRAEVGKLALDECLSQRETLNKGVVDVLTQAGSSWGVKVLRYEIRNLTPPEEIQKAMELQLTAERQKRAVIAKSEGDRQQAINLSEGQKQSQINNAEGDRQSAILRADGQSQAIATVAAATAKAINDIGHAVAGEGGTEALNYQLGQQWVQQWGQIAKNSTVTVVPANMGDLSAMVGSLLSQVGNSRPAAKA